MGGIGISNFGIWYQQFWNLVSAISEFGISKTQENGTAMAQGARPVTNPLHAVSKTC